ncbi:TetR/AcrR family transcriptional regulator [candidate division KSB1 bacterium]|nr:TetR/AcrR family transcriptional regulator [candidate division KSB1 bacterium]
MDIQNLDSKNRILKVAERIFAEKGYDAARVDEIAREAQVNKALIYYYFKSKEDILNALVDIILDDVLNLFDEVFEEKMDMFAETSVEKLLNTFLKFIEERVDLIKIILMESLKDSTKNPPLFKLADMINSERIQQLIQHFEKRGLTVQVDRVQMAITEFFTGSLPLINFIVYRDKWCQYFNISPEEMQQKFFKAFLSTHWAQHHSETL